MFPNVKKARVQDVIGFLITHKKNVKIMLNDVVPWKLINSTESLGNYINNQGWKHEIFVSDEKNLQRGCDFELQHRKQKIKLHQVSHEIVSIKN